MNSEVKAALAVLRKQGVRIPRKLTNRLKENGFVPKRSDLRKVKEWLTGLENSDKIVLSITQKGKFAIHTWDSYQKLIDTASHARKFSPNAKALVS